MGIIQLTLYKKNSLSFFKPRLFFYAFATFFRIVIQ